MINRTLLPGQSYGLIERIASVVGPPAATAPTSYRGHIIHLRDEGGCFIIHAQRMYAAPSWPELKVIIDRELQ